MRIGSIQTKVILTVMGVLALSVAVLIFFTLRNQRSNLIDEKLNNLVTTNNILTSVIQNLMLDGEAPLAVGTLTDLQEIPEFETLEIYRKNGEIAFSDYSTLEEVNRNQDMFEFSRTPRVDSKRMETKSFQKVGDSNTPLTVRDLENERMEYYFPILNYQECRACHGDDHFIRGIAYYRISLAGVFSRIEESRNTLTLYNLAIGVVVALLMILLMRRLILNPVLHIGRVVSRVGEGDLDVKSTVKSRDEIGTLSDKINGMISGLEEKNRLEVQNSVIEARNQENRKYLDNILEGLLLLGKDYRISEQYSSHLITLFGTEEVAGVYFPDFIYPDEEEQEEERRELEQFLKMLFENTSTDIDMILSINPLADKRLQVSDKEGGREIIVDANFQRIYSAGEVVNVMVIFEDKTEIVRTQEQLEEERVRSQSEVEHISSLLQMGPEAFTEFQEDAEKTLGRLDGALEGASEGAPSAGTEKEGPSAEEIASLLRDTHSLKGSARYLGFKRFGEQAHAAEEVLTAVRDGRQSLPEATESLREHTEEMREELKHSRELHERFARFAESLGGGSGENAPNRLTAFFDQLEKMTKEIAEELGKEVQVVTVSHVEDFPYLKQLRTPLIHMARNAVDHGVEEDEYERLSAEKPGTATIRFEISADDKFYRVIIADDGRGIDFEAVRSKAAEKGLIDPEREYSDKQLLSLLFSSSFSTRSEANELSGRGVGLDAVHEEVQRLGGRITVATHRGRGTKYTITLPAQRAGGGA